MGFGAAWIPRGPRPSLEGTTWYTIGASPTWYWRLWTEPILHAIHRRVLESIAEHAGMFENWQILDGASFSRTAPDVDSDQVPPAFLVVA